MRIETKTLLIVALAMVLGTLVSMPVGAQSNEWCDVPGNQGQPECIVAAEPIIGWSIWMPFISVGEPTPIIGVPACGECDADGNCYEIPCP